MPSLVVSTGGGTVKWLEIPLSPNQSVSTGSQHDRPTKWIYKATNDPAETPKGLMKAAWQTEQSADAEFREREKRYQSTEPVSTPEPNYSAACYELPHNPEFTLLTDDGLPSFNLPLSFALATNDQGIPSSQCERKGPITHHSWILPVFPKTDEEKDAESAKSAKSAKKTKVPTITLN